MRKLILFALGLVFAGFVTAAPCEKSVRWRHDPPYAWQEANGTITGLYVELARVTLERMGCTAQFVELPWARALVELEDGRLDILPGALRTPEREGFAYFSRPINESPNVLFMSRAARQKYPLKALGDIIGSNFRLGAQIKVAYGPSYDALLPNPAFAEHLTMVTDRRSAWKMIKADRLDGLIADQITGLLELKELDLSEDIVETNLVVSEGYSYFALSQRSLDATFSKRFNTTLESLFKDRSAQRIAQRFLPCTVGPNGLGCR